MPDHPSPTPPLPSTPPSPPLHHFDWYDSDLKVDDAQCWTSPQMMSVSVQVNVYLQLNHLTARGRPIRPPSIWLGDQSAANRAVKGTQRANDKASRTKREPPGWGSGGSSLNLTHTHHTIKPFYSKYLFTDPSNWVSEFIKNIFWMSVKCSQAYSVTAGTFNLLEEKMASLWLVRRKCTCTYTGKKLH